MTPQQALLRLGAVATATELRRLADPWEIRKAVESGTVVRVGPLRYALPGADEARVTAARLGGVLGGLSAAAHWNWKVKEPASLPCVIVPPWRRRGEAERKGVDLHWDVVAAEEVSRAGVTSPLRTAVDCLRWLPEQDAISVADSALRSGKVTKAELVAAAGALPRTGRVRATGLAHRADGRAANPFESVLRCLADAVPGLDPVPQGAVAGVGHGDLVDPVLGLVIEAESHEFHSEKAAFRYDCRRYTAMTRAGWRVVRFVWEDVMARQQYVIDVLTDLVASGPPPSGWLADAAWDPLLGGGS